jgi:hypothetical protein
MATSSLIAALLLVTSVATAKPKLGILSIVTNVTTGKCALRFQGLSSYRFFVVRRTEAIRARALVVPWLRKKTLESRSVDEENYSAILRRIDRYRWFCAGVAKGESRNLFCTAVDGNIRIKPSSKAETMNRREPMYFYCDDDIHNERAWNALPQFHGGIRSLKVWINLERSEVESIEWDGQR